MSLVTTCMQHIMTLVKSVLRYFIHKKWQNAVKKEWNLNIFCSDRAYDTVILYTRKVITRSNIDVMPFKVDHTIYMIDFNCKPPINSLA